MRKSILKAENITKSFKENNQETLILKDLSLEVFEQDSIAIVGSSGSGKSTLLHILGTLDFPNYGELYFQDKLINSYDLNLFRNKHLGFVFQNFYLLEDDTVMNNILMPAIIGNQKVIKNSYIYERASYLLDTVNLFSKKDTLSSALSGGEKQRVALARALINNPDILLADEPTGNLDEHNSEIIHNLLFSGENKNRAIIVVTHNSNLADLCKKKYNLTNGELILQ